jgi:hypothetical protein
VWFILLSFTIICLILMLCILLSIKHSLSRKSYTFQWYIKIASKNYSQQKTFKVNEIYYILFISHTFRIHILQNMLQNLSLFLMTSYTLNKLFLVTNFCHNNTIIPNMWKYYQSYHFSLVIHILLLAPHAIRISIMSVCE